MSIINAYGDATITNWELDDNGQKISIPMVNERKQVIGNKIVLEGLPDEQYRLFIDGFVEIDIKEKIIESNQFKVAYRNGTGVVFFHESLDGQWITVGKYFSKGQYYLPASRIWTKINDFGEVTSTLDNVIERMDEVSGTIINLDNTIKNANNTKTNLDTSITTGNAIKNNLDTNISEGNQLKLDLPPLVSSANTSKTNLETTISDANSSKTNLDNSIDTAITKKIGLDKSVTNAEIINDTLSNVTTGTIKKATDIDTTLNTSIDSAGTSNANLDNSISNANTSKANLDSSVTIANNTKADLDTSISSGVAKKTGLDDSVSNANIINDTLANPTTGNIKKATDINNTLSNNITTATAKNSDLKGTITTANTSKTNLDTSISNSITTKSDLDGSISIANTTKTALDGSITEGNALKGDLDTIIAGTDYEQIMIDVNSLKTDQHNHANKTTLDNLSDVDGKLKYNGQDVGIGDMTKAEFDSDGDGIIDKANNAEKLGGQLPSYYAKAIDSIALGETSSTAYRGDRGKTAYDHSQLLHDKNLVGLGNVDNTSDSNKPISIATQTALDEKVDNSRVLTDVPVNAKFTDTVTPMANNLTTTVEGRALDAIQGKVLDDKINILTTTATSTSLAITTLEFSELSSIATNIDSEGIYQNIEWKRKDSTLYAKSTLLGTTPNYNQIKIDYYNETGTTIIRTITWDLTYDDNNFPYTRMVI